MIANASCRIYEFSGKLLIIPRLYPVVGMSVLAPSSNLEVLDEESSDSAVGQGVLRALELSQKVLLAGNRRRRFDDLVQRADAKSKHHFERSAKNVSVTRMGESSLEFGSSSRHGGGWYQSVSHPVQRVEGFDPVEVGQAARTAIQLCT